MNNSKIIINKILQPASRTQYQALFLNTLLVIPIRNYASSISCSHTVSSKLLTTDVQRPHIRACENRNGPYSWEGTLRRYYTLCLILFEILETGLVTKKRNL